MAFFGMDSNPQNTQQHLTVERLEQEIFGQIRSLDEMKNRISIELKEIDDVENNLKVILQQAKSIDLLFINREHAVRAIYAESNKRPGEINIDFCREQFNIISKINERITPMLSHVYDELERLAVKDTHDLYAKSQANQNSMKRIDVEARKLMLKLRSINQDLKKHEEALQQVYEKISRLAHEKQMRPLPKQKIGFT